MSGPAQPPLPERYGRVAVLMGGESAERAISLQSGQAVHAALRRSGIDAYQIDLRQEQRATLAQGDFDRAFIALHGRGGEDGTLQGLLESIGIPYTGSGVLGSALAMDKVRSKWLWQAGGLPTPAFSEISEEAISQEAISEEEISDKALYAAVDSIGFPLMLKPVREGSSYGATKVENAAALRPAWLAARQFDQRVMAECWIEGEEYTVAVLGERSLPTIRVATPRGFYDYQAKYEDEATQYICPCGLEQEQERQLAALARRAFALLGASGWGRVDFMRDQAGSFWLIEANTVPGMTDHSLVPMAALAAGMTFEELVIRILDSSLQAGETGPVRA